MDSATRELLTRLTGSDTAAARDVLAERQRQVESEGWTPEHDDAYASGAMAQAAGCYAMFAAASDSARAITDLSGSLSALGRPIKGWAAWLQLWPFERKWWKPTNRRRIGKKAAGRLLDGREWNEVPQ